MSKRKSTRISYTCPECKKSTRKLERDKFDGKLKCEKCAHIFRRLPPVFARPDAESHKLAYAPPIIKDPDMEIRETFKGSGGPCGACGS